MIMKTLYQINKYTFILSICLFINPALGFLFMIPLGIVQVISSFWILFHEKRFSKWTVSLTSIHLVLSSILLFVMYNSSEFFNQLFVGCLIGAGLLAFYFMYIVYKGHQETKEKLSLTQNM